MGSAESRGSMGGVGAAQPVGAASEGSGSAVGGVRTTPPSTAPPALSVVSPIVVPFAAAAEGTGPKLGKSGKKICCSCPATKEIRDQCVTMKGKGQCLEAIEAHRRCLREEGFNV